MILYTVALIIHVIICIALVLVILAQSSKGGGLDANLGGAAMNVFGGSGASKFLKKWTQILGVVFVVSCVFLAFQVKKVRTAGPAKAKVIDEKFVDTQKPQPAQTGTPAQPQPVQTGTPVQPQPAGTK